MLTTTRYEELVEHIRVSPAYRYASPALQAALEQTLLSSETRAHIESREPDATLYYLLSEMNMDVSLKGRGRRHKTGQPTKPFFRTSLLREILGMEI